MSAVIFRNAEQSYLKWLADHPKGYVLNTRRSPSANYMVLHMATCTHMWKYTGDKKPGAFTAHDYMKVCSPDTEPLRAWIASKGGVDFTGLCSKCGPLVARWTTPLLPNADFESKVLKASKDSAAVRQARLAQAARIPAFKVVQTVVFQRNPDVIAEVLHKADGVCEGCKTNAPFKRRSDGSPYLEVHHRVRLADGGEDSVENAIALCPNCHRRTHFGKAYIL